MAKKETPSVSLLRSAVPAGRGIVRHFETADEARTAIYSDGSIGAIYTPPDAFRRLHEVLHARHSAHPRKEYPGIRDIVQQIVEDCRLAKHHWPWSPAETPPEIRESCLSTMAIDVEGCKKLNPETDSDVDFKRFAAILRIYMHTQVVGKYPPGFSFSGVDVRLIGLIASLIERGEHLAAAAAIEEAYFKTGDEWDDDPDAEEDEPEESDFADLGDQMVEIKRKYGRKRSAAMAALEKATRKPGATARFVGWGAAKINPDHMKIVILPHVQPTIHPTKGLRIATSGGRIYRPALRRPVIPQRLFYKRSMTMPGGAVLFDASASMGVSAERLADCCSRAPRASVAYYSGNDDTDYGTLVIYAQNGMRALSLHGNYPSSGNGCDGAAFEWLMKQEAPRVFVTDCGFTGPDSVILKVRVERLAHEGEIELIDSYEEFKRKFPKSELSEEEAA